MSAPVTLVRNDARLLWRRGVVVASLAVVVLYVVLLRAIGPATAAVVLPFLVFSDPAALGFFFAGGVALVERGEGTAAALAVTPARPWELVGARAGGLAALGTVGAALIAGLSGVAIRWPLFVAAAGLTAVAYTLLGLAVSMRSGTVNEYFARATVVSVPLFAPLGAVIAFPDSPWLAAWPTTASLGLLRSSVLGERAMGGVEMALAVVVLSITCVAAAVWAHRELLMAVRTGRI